MVKDGAIYKSAIAAIALTLFAALLALGGCTQPAAGGAQGTSSDLAFEDSPFGVFTAYTYFEFAQFNEKAGMSGEEYMDWADNHMGNIGAHWTRSNLQLSWDIVEPEIGKGYDWDNKLETDTLIKRIYASKNGVNWLGVFQEGSGGKEEKLPGGDVKVSRNMLDYPDEYKAFVKAAVERYDGDGIDDASSDVKVKWWQAGNENMSWKASGRTVQEYADFVRLIRDGAKAADPEAKIILISSMDGRNRDDFIDQVIEELADEKAFDAIDIHFWSMAGEWKMDAVKKYRAFLDSKGLDDVQIWSNEHGTWAGQPKGSAVNQTESDQASSMVKRYAYNIANGLDRLLWNNIVEWQNFNGQSDSMFNSQGLVADGAGKGEDTTMFNIPRLSYYSYKLMTEKLEGSDWDAVEKVSESNNLYAYKFENKESGRNVWVAWWEDESGAGSEKTVTLDVEGSGDFVVTKAVPTEITGKNIDDYSSAFEYVKVSPENGEIELTLIAGQGPVYVESEKGWKGTGAEVDGLSAIEDYNKERWLAKMTGSTDGGQAGGLNEETKECMDNCVQGQGRQPADCIEICDANMGGTTGGTTTDQECMKNCVEVEKKMPPVCAQECGIDITVPPGGTGAGGATTNPLCGDGKCDDIEKANPSICPADCS